MSSNQTSDEVIDLDQKRIEKEYRETGMIKCNLPFVLGSDEMNNKNFWKGFRDGWAKGFIILSPIIGLIIWEIVT